MPTAGPKVMGSTLIHAVDFCTKELVNREHGVTALPLDFKVLIGWL